MKVLEAFGDEAGNGSGGLMVCVAVIESDYADLSASFESLLDELCGLPQHALDAGLRRRLFHATENRAEVVNIFLGHLAQLPGIRAFCARGLRNSSLEPEGERLIECYAHLMRIVLEKYSDYDLVSLSVESGSHSSRIVEALNFRFRNSQPRLTCHELPKGKVAISAIPDFVLWVIERLRHRIADESMGPYHGAFEYARAQHLRGVLSYVRDEDGNPAYERRSPGIECATVLSAREDVD